MTRYVEFVDPDATVKEAAELMGELDVGALPAGGEERVEGIVTESLAEKVLHGWLQNRHQTLYPLTLNLRTLDATGATLLAQVMAVALLSAIAPPDAGDLEAASSWLGGVGGNEQTVAALRTALETPPPLSTLLNQVQRANLSAYAYVVATAAGPSRDPAGGIFLEYLAARLGLPTSVVRSANRRYRR